MGYECLLHEELQVVKLLGANVFAFKGLFVGASHHITSDRIETLRRQYCRRSLLG
jgi:hypothetical protein